MNAIFGRGRPLLVVWALAALGVACDDPVGSSDPGDTQPAPNDVGTMPDAGSDLDGASSDAGAPDAGSIGPCGPTADPFDVESLRGVVDFLAADDRGGRAPGTDGDRETRDLIAARFECVGLEPAGGRYQHPFTDDNGDATGNVIGVLSGADPQVADDLIVVGAHHDHLGIEAGHTFNGANDNASGAATLMAIAERLARGERPRRTVVFVAFGSEETGLVGSQRFVQSPDHGLSMDRVVFMLNLDMVGNYDRAGVVFALGSNTSSIAGPRLQEIAAGTGLSVIFGIPGERSDHEPFCDQGIPYVFFWTPDAECYHEACDTTDRVDYPHMADIGRMAAELVSTLAGSEVDLRAARLMDGCGN